MKQVTMCKAHDGTLHATHGECRSYMQSIYDNLLLSLAGGLRRSTVHDASIFIDSRLQLFVELKKIKDSLLFDTIENE